MLYEKNLHRSSKVGIIGLGYIGLPLAILCAEKGYQVLGIDKDAGRVESIGQGKSYITDLTDKKIRAVLQSGKPQAIADYSLAPSCDVILFAYQHH